MESAYWAIRILLPEKLFELVVRQASRVKRFDITCYVKVEVMSKVVDYLVENLNASVVLIPHHKEPRLDDTILAREILQRAKQRKRVRLITGDYSASELKAVIGQCDLFVGAKMHANIAALSMNVPTVAIQYSHKFYGIMRLLGQEQYICDKFTEEEVESTIDQAWSNREKIRVELEAKTGILKEHAIYNAKLVADLLDSKRASISYSRMLSAKPCDTSAAEKGAKVLIINTPGLLNKGGMAVVMGAIRCLRDTMPNAHVVVLCHHCKGDWYTLQDICRRQRVEVRKHPWFKEHDSRLITLLHSSVPALLTLLQCITCRTVNKLGLPLNGIFQGSDIILDLNVDALNDHYGVFFPSWALFNILLGIIAGKPIVVWAASIGSFDNRLTRFLARFTLNRVDMITAREEVTREYLETLGVSKPRIYVTADHAFLMEPAPSERISEVLAKEGISNSQNPLIGISASQLIYRYAFPGIKDKEEKYQRYVEVMTGTIDYLADKLNADILLIPHVLVPNYDDRIISGKLYERVKNKNMVKLITGEYMADELKGIIGVCDMFIGCRMHSTIASTSMSVPTIAIVYGHKSHGVLGDVMGQGKYIREI